MSFKSPSHLGEGDLGDEVKNGGLSLTLSAIAFGDGGLRSAFSSMGNSPKEKPFQR